MTLRTARLIQIISRIFLALSLAGLLAFFIVYFRGGISFKFFSLPLMTCVISITWLVMSNVAVITIAEEENSSERNERGGAGTK